MTIHQLPKPCFVLDPNPHDDGGSPHYESWREADEELRQMREDRGPDPRDLAAIESCHSARLPASCWVAECAGCGDELTDEEEAWTVHASSLASLYASLDAYDWRLCVDEAYCPDCAPEGSSVPPIGADEQEAAGQLVIPGVIP